MTTETSRQSGIWTHPPQMLAIMGVAAVVLAALFWEGLANLAKVWSEQEEYSHGLLIPAISLFLVWQLKNRFEQMPYNGSWVGVLLVLGGVILLLLGEFATIYIIVQYGFLFTLAGLAWSMVGNRAFLLLIVPLVYLSFMVPLPRFLYNNLSGQLQLISSELGVAVIRAFGISVHLEGNVIDLGIYQLQVVEACNGLRYLFPLASFAFLAAYLYRAPMWKRVVVFLSSLPITVIMNSFRIGIIGVLVEHFGISQAEGFLHFFEGWVIFMACIGLLLGEIWVLQKIGRDRRPFSEVFGIDFPDKTPADIERRPRSVPRQFYASIAVMVVALVGLTLMTQRPQTHPERVSLENFPLQVGPWRGTPIDLEQRFITTLDFTDYTMANYVLPGTTLPVQFYAAYYKEQRTKGNAAHSPRSCIPGGGWQITGLTRHQLELPGREPITLNRLQIEKGQSKQLVYYYFKQRDRELASEYAVKWYLFYDALTRNRSDGALVRFITPVEPGAPDWEKADQRLGNLASQIIPMLDSYVPD